jgi:hypothetical protein
VSPERRQDLAWRIQGRIVRDGEGFPPNLFVDITNVMTSLLVEIVDLESRVAVERSKWCHFCGAPWDWARPRCRFCDTSKPPELR